MKEFWDYILNIESEYSDCRKKIMNEFSLSAAEVDVLMFVANNPERDTAADVSRLRKIPKSQVSMSVRSLSEKKLLRGEYRGNNKKSIHLSITPEAEKIVSYGKKVQQEFFEALFVGFSEEERRTFFGYHKKIAENLNKERTK